MALDFPASPSVGQKYPASPLAGIPTYTWDGEKWTTIGGAVMGANAVCYDIVQSLTAPQQQQAQQNINVAGADVTRVNNILADNGGFEVWQRSGPLSSVSVGIGVNAYTADRWYLSTSTGQASTVGPVAGITNGSQTAGNIKRNSGQTGTAVLTFGYPLTTAEVAQLRGSKCALSFTAKAGANWSPASGNITVFFQTGTGTEAKAVTAFAGAINVITSTIALTPTATQFTFASAAVVPANATQGEVFFQWAPVGTAGADDSFTLDDVQLEIGAVAHPFSRIAFRDMLEHCQAFYWKTFPYNTPPAQNAGVIGTVNTDYAYVNAAGCVTQPVFPRRMRVAPTMITYAPDAANGNFSGGGSVAAAIAREWGAVLIAASNTTAGNSYSIHITADASI